MTRQYKEKMQAKQVKRAERVERGTAERATYCLVCKKNAENEDAKMVTSKNNRIMLMSTSVVCGNKKSKFVREKDAKGLLSNLGIKIPLLSALF